MNYTAHGRLPVSTLDPYAQLAAAVLQRVVWDATGQIHATGALHDIRVTQMQALTFLADDEAVMFWAELSGADGPTIVRAMRQAVHAAEGAL